MLYSASTGGFYSHDVHGGDIPEDAVEISDLVYEALLAAQEAGKRIQAGDDGHPVAVDPPPPTATEVLQMNTAMRDSKLAIATARIAPLQDAVDLGVATPDEEAALLAWKRYRVDLNRLDLAGQIEQWPSPPED